ncbi:2552_t:CDS:2 [Dentiscutata erythropus]|uniref:2552_t:CDS:1 n=1 Tax=Dentiscutata erythropus TaxID=1348616 RepID=A0A9N9H540_9GLOM|nr:2552_t:CDS:2 [Dentiscutata erythropus]
MPSDHSFQDKETDEDNNLTGISSLLSNIIDEIKRICHAARYNKLICNIFIELVICSAEPIVRLLQYKKDDMCFESENLKLDDLTVLEQFKIALVNIKEFSKCITQIYSYIQYKDVISIKETFEQIIERYRTCVKDMNPRFSITDINEYERLKDDEIDDFATICFSGFRGILLNALRRLYEFIKKQSLVKDKKLDHSLMICNQGINPAHKLNVQLIINHINHDAGNFQVNLVIPKSKRDTFLLNNHIKLSAISFDQFHRMSKIVSSKLVNEPANQVYLEIQYPLWELIFKKENIILPEQLINDIKSALEYNDPYHKLMQIFEDYGHFIPSKVVLGHKLYRVPCLAKNSTLSEKKEFVSREYFETAEFNEFWSQWESSIARCDFGESFLLSSDSFDSKPFKRSDLKEWFTSCLNNNFNGLQIISWEKLHPLYEILDDNLKQKVKSILGIVDHAEDFKIKKKVLMSGVVQVTEFYYYTVELPYPLNFKNYQIFGKILTQDGKPINHTVIKFKDMTKRKFSIMIDIDKIKSIYVNLQILWIMVGSPEIGFYSRNTRDISILASGSHKFVYAKNLEIPLPIPENLPEDSIICSSFKYPKNCGPNFMANIQYNNGNKVKANIYDDSDLHPSVYNKTKKEYLFQWCILSGNHEIIIDDNSSSPEKMLKLKSIGQYPYENLPKEPRNYEYGVISHWIMVWG